MDQLDKQLNNLEPVPEKVKTKKNWWLVGSVMVAMIVVGLIFVLTTIEINKYKIVLENNINQLGNEPLEEEKTAEQKSEAYNFFKELESEGIVFGVINEAVFKWRDCRPITTCADSSEIVKIYGYGAVLEKSSVNIYELLRQKGFKKAIANEADGTISGSSGYQKDNMACEIGNKYQGKKSEIYEKLRSGQSDDLTRVITLECGLLPKEGSYLSICNLKDNHRYYLNKELKTEGVLKFIDENYWIDKGGLFLEDDGCQIPIMSWLTECSADIKNCHKLEIMKDYLDKKIILNGILKEIRQYKYDEGKRRLIGYFVITDINNVVIDEVVDWRDKCIKSGGQVETVCASGIPPHCQDLCSCDRISFVEVTNKNTGEKIEKAYSFRILKDNECFDCQSDIECQEQNKDSWCQEDICYKKFK